MVAAMRPVAAAMLSAALLLCVAAPARAQVLLGYLFGEKLSSENFNLGFEVGVNFSSLDGFAGADRVHHPVFGLFGDWRFSEHFHLGGAILPLASRGAEGLTPVATGDPALDTQTTGATMERSTSYVEIPLLLKWAPKRQQGFRAGAGPSLGIVTGATDRYRIVSAVGTPYVLERDIADRLPGLDMGLAMEVEWRFKMLSIAARYTDGLTDMRLEGAPDAVHSRVLTGTGRIYLGKQPR